MNFTIVIPHYKEWRITTYTLYRILQHMGTKHKAQIIVVNNAPENNDRDYFLPFMDRIDYVEWPGIKLQSHGTAFDHAIRDYTYFDNIITLESDSYPTIDNWLNYYEVLSMAGYDFAGSYMQLSGGFYTHPAGAWYKRALWDEAKKYCDDIPYDYYPNIAMKEGFQCHGMIHSRIADQFLKNPSKFIELAPGYVNNSPLRMTEKLEYYSSIRGPFHNGMGSLQESIKTYGQRSFETDTKAAIIDGKDDIIYRIGYEPGQWLSYYLTARGYKGYNIPTRIQWMDKREYQQQEYTITENGLKHLWGISAYYKGNNPDIQDILTFKEKQVQELYDSMPDKYKIPSKTTED